VIELSDAQARRLRLRGHRLLGDHGVGTVHDVVRDVCGLQAQEVRAYPLSVRARLRGAVADDVQRARVEERSVLRGWYMRGTLHLVAAEDAAWLLALVGPRMVRAGASRRRQLGIDEDTYARALHVIREALAAHGPLSRRAIAARLETAGIDPSEQRNIHILGRAALEGVICTGPPTGNGADSAFVLTEDWLGAQWMEPLPSRPAMLAQLARRYLAAHAPAGPLDLATWSGLAVPEAREGFRLVESELVEARVRGHAHWILAAQRESALARVPRTPLVRVVPVFDGYLLGHRSRELIVPPHHARYVLPGGGWLNPTVLVDGVAVAQWTTASARDGATSITVHPYESWDPSWDKGMDAEVVDMARFRGVAARWHLGEPVGEAGAVAARSRS
jgi:hypothetical protein